MKKLTKSISLLLCIAMTVCALSSGVSATWDIGDISTLKYTGYTYIGDSVSWGGYGLTELDSRDPDNTFIRVTNCYGDIIGSALEKQNGAKVWSAVCAGASLCDFRYIIERSLGYENPFEHSDWFTENYDPERTVVLRSKSDVMKEALSQSNLVTIELGMNDLFCNPILTMANSGMFDSQDVKYEDYASLGEYFAALLQSLAQNGDTAREVIKLLTDGVESFRDNMIILIDEIYEIAPEGTDIVLVGSYNLFGSMVLSKAVPGTALLDSLAQLFVASNKYLNNIANMYPNVYYVDIPDTEIIFPEGTVIADLLAESSGTAGLIKGVHPSPEAHKYIAGRIVDLLINKSLKDEHNLEITLSSAESVNTVSVNGEEVYGTFFDSLENKLSVPCQNANGKTMLVSEVRENGNTYTTAYRLAWGKNGYTAYWLYSTKTPYAFLSMFTHSGIEAKTLSIQNFLDEHLR